jgi:hypothetical protein
VFRLSNIINENITGYLAIFKKSKNYHKKLKVEFIEYMILQKEDIWNNDELRFFKMFKILQRLYEKSVEIDITDKANSPKEGQETPPAPAQDNPDQPPSPAPGLGPQPQPGEKPSGPNLKNVTSENTRQEVRSRFSALMERSDLNKLWMDMAELMNLLWSELEESQRVLVAMTSKMKPLIECFFIVYRILYDDDMVQAIKKKINRNYAEPKKTGLEAGKTDLAQLESQNNDLTQTPPDESTQISAKTFSELRKIPIDLETMFLIMCEKNKKILNHLIKQNINLLSDSLSILAKKLPKILDFDNKRAYFKLALSHQKSSYRPIELTIRRSEIFPDSYNQLISKSPAELKGKLRIKFKDEEGYDAGGVAREWFLELSRLIFDPIYALFIKSAGEATYQPSPKSYINPEHCQFFKFVGRIIGKVFFLV